MKPLACFIGLVATGLAGCVTPFGVPPDVAHIALERGDSPVVRVTRIWLEKRSGPLAVNGYVLRRPDATDTTQTHLDVTLYDETGQVLRSTVEHFKPQQIPRRFRRPDDAFYRVVLDPLPAGTTRILVQAHEGNH